MIEARWAGLGAARVGTTFYAFSSRLLPWRGVTDQARVAEESEDRRRVRTLPKRPGFVRLKFTSTLSICM